MSLHRYIVWLGVLLVFATCLAYPQSTNSSLQPGTVGNTPNVLSLIINTKKYVHTISDHFLSITLEPSTIFLALQKKPGSTVINMARGLSPAFIRISGPENNYFKFQGGQDTSQSSPILPTKHGKNNITVTGWHWSQLNEFVAKTGLDLIVGLNIMNRQHGVWDLSNTLDLISYSDKHGYNMAFQLGNDIQEIGSRIDGVSLGRDATRLRKILEAFPRYKNSAIIGPDIKSCETQEEARYLKNFIIESGSSISAVTYQVPFSSEKNVENPTEMLSYIQNQLESRVWQKDLINKYLGKISVKKPLWIAESGNKDRKGDFMDGLIWAQRLCAGAKVGINTIMRKPSLLSLSEPTPDYWVSVLHKAIIGSEVLDIKISSGNKTRLETVAHCTKMSPFDPNEGILAPEYRYSRGAITIFGVNMGLENVKILLKTEQKQSLPVHQYFLTSSNRQNIKRATRSSSTLINGQKLILSPDGELPIISPKIRGSHQMITIPNQCVFFLVLPDIKSKACTAIQVEDSKEPYTNGGRIVDQDEFDNIDYDIPVLDKDDESMSNEKNIYVAFRPKYIKTYDDSVVPNNEKQEISKLNNNEMAQQRNDESYKNDSLQQPEPVVKYVTFSNNNWLSKFPKSLSNQEYSIERSTFSPINPTELPIIEIQTEKNITPFQSKREMYHILSQAVTGKRFQDKNIRSDVYPNLDAAIISLKPLQKLKLVKRSLDGTNYSSKENLEMVEEFTNKDKQLLDEHLKIESSTEVPTTIKQYEGYSKVSQDIKKYQEVPKDQDAVTSQITQQTMINSTPVTSTTAVSIKKYHESHIQKIKTRKEQALAKVNEITSKIHRRKPQEKHILQVINPNVSLDEMSTMSTTKDIITKKEPFKTIENISNLAKSARYNRQTNNTNTDENMKIGKLRVPHILLKSKKSEKPEVVENNIYVASSPEAKITHFEPSTTEIPTSKTTKLRNVTLPKTFKLFKHKDIVIDVEDLNNTKTTIRESRETTLQPTLKPKFRPVLHPLGRVKTTPNVDVDQIATNEKITAKLFNNIRDGKKTLQYAHIVSPRNKNGESNLETKPSSTVAVAAKIRALEAKLKMRRSEMERRFNEKIHNIKKRSPTNDIIEDDIMDINNILSSDRFGSNELNVDVGPVLQHETIRIPRSVADFTVKLNEVNTYVDKNKGVTKDPKTNEITEDNLINSSPKNWRNTNDIRFSEEDNEVDNINIKSKRKSIFEEIDDDDYSKTTTHMMNTLFNHMKKLWKYLKKTFIF